MIILKDRYHSRAQILNYLVEMIRWNIYEADDSGSRDMYDKIKDDDMWFDLWKWLPFDPTYTEYAAWNFLEFYMNTDKNSAYNRSELLAYLCWLYQNSRDSDSIIFDLVDKWWDEFFDVETETEWNKITKVILTPKK